MIYLRPATDDDMSLVLAWRNSPLIWQGFYTQSKNREPIDWQTHYNWWHSRNQDWRIFIVMFAEDDFVVGTLRPIGVVNIGQLDYWSPEIGYYIGNPKDWGEGYGKEAVKQAIDWIKEYAKTHTHISHIHTTVLEANEHSTRLLKSLGFEIVRPAREGENHLRLKL